MIDIIWQPQFQQVAFRQLLEAFARPGSIARLPASGGQAWLGVLATLVDGETSLADPHGLLSELDWRRLQLEPEAAEKARFVLVDGGKSCDFEPQLGTLASPEQGATIVLKITALSGGPSYNLSGPGIAGCRELSPVGLLADWLKRRNDWNQAFPLGVDLILLAGDDLLALPRTTRIKEQN